MAYVPQLPPSPQRLSNVVPLFPSTTRTERREASSTSNPWQHLNHVMVMKQAREGSLNPNVVEALLVAAGVAP